jgi:ABC-type bacteriocin/lantibiotic exporter with double-glycine peptidase domain
VVGSAGSAFLQSMPGLGRVLALAAGAVLVMQDEWSLGSLLAFLAYLSDVFGPAQFLAAAGLQLQSARASLERMGAILDRAPEGTSDDSAAAVSLGGELELRDVSFAYPDAPVLLNGVSLHVRPGEAVALVGPSGAGKTTLAGLILGFYRPAAGDIVFDGRPIESYPLGALRRRLGYVPQRPTLASGSILDNLRFGNPEASIAEVTGAARAAAIHEDILRLPQGYRTEVGEGGLMLSEGQRQRIALARALLMDPDVLILDEPTAALDAAAERALIAGIQEWRRGRTMLVITHRMSTAACCDGVMHLSEGRVFEAGAGKHCDRRAGSDILPHSNVLTN